MDAWEAGSRGVVEPERTGGGGASVVWFGWLEKDAGGEISHFFNLSKSPRGETSGSNVDLFGGRRRDLGIACLSLRIRSRSSPSHVSLIPDSLSRRTSCRPVLLFGQVGLGWGGCSKVCMRAQRNVKTPVLVSWGFVVFSIALTIAPSTSAATPVRHFSQSHASICALFCAFAPARKRFVRRTAHTSLLFVVCVFSQSECSFSGFFFNFSSFSNLAEIHGQASWLRCRRRIPGH